MNIHRFLVADDIIDWNQSDVANLAGELNENDPYKTAKRCFDWVRDEIRHSIDHHEKTVTISASGVFNARTGLCYAKSHLLAALLRANKIPAGFGYQRLSLDEKLNRYCLHGFNAIWLPDLGWYRVDARGNRTDIRTEFDPPHERLAFQANQAGEITFSEIHDQPLPVVIESLRNATSLDSIDWPDLNLTESHSNN